FVDVKVLRLQDVGHVGDTGWIHYHATDDFLLQSSIKRSEILHRLILPSVSFSSLVPSWPGTSPRPPRRSHSGEQVPGNVQGMVGRCRRLSGLGVSRKWFAGSSGMS